MYLAFGYSWPGKSGSWYGDEYSGVFDRREGQIPPIIVDYAKFDHDEREKTFVCSTVEIEFTAQEMLGIECS